MSASTIRIIPGVRAMFYVAGKVLYRSVRYYNSGNGILFNIQNFSFQESDIVRATHANMEGYATMLTAISSVDARLATVDCDAK